MNTEWFQVDREGLRKLLAERGIQFAVWELLSNAWDADSVTEVAVEITPVEGRPEAEIVVVDDSPVGFQTLAHAWTLFAESNRKGEAEKRGRWNLGEKLFLSLCTEARIVTTTGGVRFDAQGRHAIRQKRAAGSEVRAILRCTRQQLAELVGAIDEVIPPVGVRFGFNGKERRRPEARASITTTLATEIADAQGYLRRSRRQGTIQVFEPGPAGAWIYEMGIPVERTGDRWSYDVLQKVPLTTDRTAVAAVLLYEVRVAVLNELGTLLQGKEVEADWVRRVAGDVDIRPEVTAHLIQQRFGDKVVAYDPSDPEANGIAASQGYTVVPGGALTAGEWSNVRGAGAALPAGRVTPSPRILQDEDGEPPVPRDQWTVAMVERAEQCAEVGRLLLGHDVAVRYYNSVKLGFGACYGKGSGLGLNLGRLGKAWLDEPLMSDRVMALLLHEYAHEYASDHLCSQYHEACCKLGAKLARLAAAHHFKDYAND